MDLRKSLQSFKYAFRGLRFVFQENNSKVHLVASFMAVLTGFVMKINLGEWLWIILAITLVWIAETINTAIEKLTDLVHPSYHPLAGKVKDISAASVFMASLFAVVVALLVFMC